MPRKPSTSASARIPNIVKHCAVAIFQDPNIRGEELDRFATAVKYAVSRLSEYGYLTSSSKEVPAANVVLTTKGSQRERHHTSEGRQKSALFDKLYESLARAQARDGDRQETQAPPPAPRKKR